MLNQSNISDQIIMLIHEWTDRLLALDCGCISKNRNIQKRNIKQIVGHMVDSASNNTHRIIHLQYQESPINFPDYANLGVNDQWIALQNYEEAKWEELVYLWKYTNLHIAHIINQVDSAHLNKIWISALKDEVSLEAMIEDFPRHMLLHLNQIAELISA